MKPVLSKGEAMGKGPVSFTPIGCVENSFDAPATRETIAASESRIIIAPEFAE